MIIENGTVRNFWYSFLFAFIAAVAVSLAVSTQYTDVTDRYPAARHHTTA